MLNHRQRRWRRLQAGLSLVEMMVGMAIGLVVVAGAALVVGTQLGDSRRLLLETQLQQDLRAAADIITRELRRSGSWAYDDLAYNSVWSPSTSGVNSFTPVAVTGTPASEVTYRYYRNASESDFGFRLNTTTNTLQSNIVGGGYQDLTDARIMKVTGFTIALSNGPGVSLPCPNDCPAGGTACWPTLTVRQIAVDISAVSTSDPSVKRNLRLVTQLRNDVVTPYATGQVCP